MTTANGPTAFADDGSAVISRTVDVQSVKHSNLESLYEIDRTVDAILKGNYQRITLQFPDELLADAASVATELEKRTGQHIYVLADTSYGSCCVDEVAAEHVNADLIIHYGRSCLSPTSHLPVLYVFGQQSLDQDHCIHEFEQLFPDPSIPVIVMCDVEYSYAVESLVKRLSNKYTNIIPTSIQTESKLQAVLGNDNNKEEQEASSSPTTTTKGGRYYELPEDIAIEDCSIFFIGAESLTLTNIMMIHNKCPVYTYNPKTREARRETVQVNRLLMKRYSLVQKAKDAETFGIVVGTLGVGSYMDIIDHVKKVIRASGRKSYTMVMGKLNVAKMANFMEVDCYVLVACPENSLIDSKEFYRPIVTPFELELAVVRSKEWTGDYITDFSKLLPNVRTDGFSYQDEEQDDVSSDEEPHFSLVTGRYVSSTKTRVKNNVDEQALTSSLTDLTIRNNSNTISRLLDSTAGEYLKNRSFRGLEQNLGQTEVSTIQEGRSGIARGYQGEKDL
ncbi:diphthamide biosynthesis protein 2 [Lichtheimia ornata]|uniref:2-(3-amino-3-carboxypropyl)histidine synthase subunit 2 n=1 Tax=Lichtheimia ornata TaxID=688661 RepID=A0AAD7V0T9_9FUNG|nr:diphthamide biosynthesis protein 2 [Lichtheimia ornata]KAJ8655646.1 diphthamide biosynthesis protein 2 [Lichtheimia ornata]